jgi:glycosyltransferase involved in cell wall biosynthesis
MGYAQGLETILEAAEHCEDDRIRFVMVGGGVLHGYLSGEVQKRQLTNVTLLDHQPYTEMPEVYGASDVCLVPLLGNISGSALPSKVFRIMACGRPVLALCDPESEMATVVRDAGAGIVVPAGRWDLLLDAVHTLLARDALRVDLGRNGRSFVERNYSRDAVTGEYVRLVTALAGRT